MSTAYKTVTVPEYEDHADGPKAFKDLVDGILPLSGGTITGSLTVNGHNIAYRNQVFLTTNQNVFSLGTDQKGSIYIGDGMGREATAGIEASWSGVNHPTLAIGVTRDGAKAHMVFRYDGETQIFSTSQLRVSVKAVGTTLHGRTDTDELLVYGVANLRGNTNVAADLTAGGLVSVGGAGIRYNGCTAAGSNNVIGFRWSSPNINGKVDNAVQFLAGVASDRRLKTNFSDLSGKALAMLNKMPAVFSYNGVNIDGTVIPDAVHYGMIADEMEPAFPDLVMGEATKDEYQSIAYLGIVPLLVEAVRELSGKVAALESA